MKTADPMHALVLGAPDGITKAHRALAILCVRLEIPWGQAHKKVDELSGGLKRILSVSHPDRNKADLDEIEHDKVRKEFEQDLAHSFNRAQNGAFARKSKYVLKQGVIPDLLASIKTQLQKSVHGYIL